jgi:hypothetical protein
MPAPADVAEYRARLHGRQLVAVAQKDESAARRQRPGELCHERQVNHGSLIHDDDFKRQGIGLAKPEARRVRDPSQQAMQRRNLFGDEIKYVRRTRHSLYCLLDRLAKARRRLACWRRERNPETRLARPPEQQGQDFNHSRGLAGTRPAGNHGQDLADRGERGDSLIIGLLAAVPGEQAVQAAAQQRKIDIRGRSLDARPEKLHQNLFVTPVAVQIEPACAIQDQRLELPRHPDRLRPFQGGKPNIPWRADKGCSGFLFMPGHSRSGFQVQADIPFLHNMACQR